MPNQQKGTDTNERAIRENPIHTSPSKVNPSPRFQRTLDPKNFQKLGSRLQHKKSKRLTQQNKKEKQGPTVKPTHPPKYEGASSLIQLPTIPTLNLIIKP